MFIPVYPEVIQLFPFFSHENPGGAGLPVQPEWAAELLEKRTELFEVKQHIPKRHSSPTTPVFLDHMEAKAKSGAQVPKPSTKVGKTENKEASQPKKVDPTPVEPLTPAVPVEELPVEDVAAEPEGASESGVATEPSTDSLESLKPFLIGGAIIAAGAILLGALLLARRN